MNLDYKIDIQDYLMSLNFEDFFIEQDGAEIWDEGIIYWISFENIDEAIHENEGAYDLLKRSEDMLSICCGEHIYKEIDDAPICTKCKEYV